MNIPLPNALAEMYMRLLRPFSEGADGVFIGGCRPGECIIAEFMNDFSNKARELGPLGKGEGIAANELKSRLNEVFKLEPYIARFRKLLELAGQSFLNTSARLLGMLVRLFASREFDLANTTARVDAFLESMG